MARKLNWEKARAEKVLADQIREQFHESNLKSDYYRLRDKGLWPINGKNKGKPISSLDESYLNFIVKKFSGDPKILAQTELKKRKLAHDEKLNQAREKIKSLRQKNST